MEVLQMMRSRNELIQEAEMLIIGSGGGKGKEKKSCLKVCSLGKKHLTEQLS